MELTFIEYGNKEPELSIKIYNNSLIAINEFDEIVVSLQSFLYKKENRNLLLALRYFYSFARYSEMLEYFGNYVFQYFPLLKNIESNSLISLIQFCINDICNPNLKNSKTDHDGSKEYQLDFETGFFDFLSEKTLAILNNIFKNCQKKQYDYINSKLWEEYVNENIENIEIVTNQCSFTVKNKIPSFQPPNIASLENPNNGILYHQKVNNEEELLYAFLNMLFCPKDKYQDILDKLIKKQEKNINTDNVQSHNYQKKFHYVILKCKKCHKFMIKHRTDDLYCNRKNEYGYTCKYIAINNNKYKYRDDFTHKLEKRIRDLYNSSTRNKKKDAILRERKEKFQKSFPDKRSSLSARDYLYWLANHYEKANKRQKTKLEIDEYLENNPEFENYFKQKYHTPANTIK